MITRCIIIPDNAADAAVAQAAPALHALATSGEELLLLTRRPITPTVAATLPRLQRTDVEHLLRDLSADARIPAAVFRNPTADTSYRIALALRRLLAATPGLTVLDFRGPMTSAYFTLKWRRLWGDEFAAVSILLHPQPTCDPQREPLPFERRKDAQREAYCRRYADQTSAIAGSAPPPSPRNPLVSIVIPYHEAHRTIDATLDSVLASSYPQWEAIVIDDGSPTAAARQTFDRLQQRFAADARFHFLRQANGGLAAARNAGIRHARGSLLLPLDSDDLIAPTYLARAVQALERNPDLVAVSCFATHFLDGTPPARITGYVIPYDLDPVLIALENRAGVACSVFRRSLFDRFQYDETFRSLEDWDFWWSLAEAGLAAEVMPEVLYRYRRRHDSLINAMPAATRAALIGRLQEKHSGHLRAYGDGIAACYAEWIHEWETDRAKRDRRLRFLAPAIDVAKSLVQRLRKTDDPAR